MRKSYNVQVKLRPGEPQERLLKRFVKKCKKLEIIQEHLDKVAYFKSKKERRRQKKLEAIWLHQLEQAKKKSYLV